MSAFDFKAGAGSLSRLVCGIGVFFAGTAWGVSSMLLASSEPLQQLRKENSFDFFFGFSAPVVATALSPAFLLLAGLPVRLLGLRLALDNFCASPLALLGEAVMGTDDWLAEFDDVRTGTLGADDEVSKVFEDGLRLVGAVVVTDGDAWRD